MRRKEIESLFSRKCWDLGGEVYMSLDGLTCHLDSIKKGREMMRFIEKLDAPDDEHKIIGGVKIKTESGLIELSKVQWRNENFSRYIGKIVSRDSLPFQAKKMLVAEEKAVKLERVLKEILPKEYRDVYAEGNGNENETYIDLFFDTPKNYGIDPIFERIVEVAEDFWSRIADLKMTQVGEKTFLEI
ncbi:hypothetical protein [Candidatus Methanodesulfokora washburnensis]|nr:hypothetical protein [Candidatus Methanodesulfokores washburnensis]